MLTISDEIIIVSERYYVKATATIMEISTGEKIEVSAFARESLSKKGQDESQITGTASSYARKYALNGLFLLDDTKDADSDEYHNQTKKDEPSEKEQKEVEGIKKQKISELKVKAIQTAIANAKVDPQSVLATYKIKTFEEMTEEMFLDANKKLGKM
jgi:cell pole-organizing protein PopZ